MSSGLKMLEKEEFEKLLTKTYNVEIELNDQLNDLSLAQAEEYFSKLAENNHITSLTLVNTLDFNIPECANFLKNYLCNNKSVTEFSIETTLTPNVFEIIFSDLEVNNSVKTIKINLGEFNPSNSTTNDDRVITKQEQAYFYSKFKDFIRLSPNLTTVKIEENTKFNILLNKDALSHLLEGIKNNPLIHTFKFNKKLILKTNEESLNVLYNFIKQNINLKSLDLPLLLKLNNNLINLIKENNTIEELGYYPGWNEEDIFNEWQAMLNDKTNLTKLETRINPREFNENLKKILLHNNSLHELNLEYINDFDYELRGIISNHPSLNSLKIKGVESEKTLIKLIDSVKKNNSIKKLDFEWALDFTEYTNDTIIAFADIINYVEDLNIAQCGIADKNFEIICQAIQTSKTIRNIDFSSNEDITDLTPFAQALSENSSLKNLNMQSLGQVTEGISEFLKAIANSELIFESINLKGSSYDLCSKLPELIKYDKCYHLILAGCFLEKDDLAKIVEFLPLTKNLLELNLKENEEITDEEAQELIGAAIQNNKNIRRIVFDKSSNELVLKKTLINRKNIDNILDMLVKVANNKELHSFPFNMLKGFEERQEVIKYLLSAKINEDENFRAISTELTGSKDCEKLILNLYTKIYEYFLPKTLVCTERNKDSSGLLNLPPELQSKIFSYLNDNIGKTEELWQNKVKSQEDERSTQSNKKQKTEKSPLR
ncbi:MAG: hypothetical protein ACK4OM_01385 [Alphaproteobacteria bacterium]